MLGNPLNYLILTVFSYSYFLFTSELRASSDEIKGKGKTTPSIENCEAPFVPSHQKPESPLLHSVKGLKLGIEASRIQHAAQTNPAEVLELIELVNDLDSLPKDFWTNLENEIAHPFYFPKGLGPIARFDLLISDFKLFPSKQDLRRYRLRSAIKREFSKITKDLDPVLASRQKQLTNQILAALEASNSLLPKSQEFKIETYVATYIAANTLQFLTEVVEEALLTHTFDIEYSSGRKVKSFKEQDRDERKRILPDLLVQIFNQHLPRVQKLFRKYDRVAQFIDFSGPSYLDLKRSTLEEITRKSAESFARDQNGLLTKLSQYYFDSIDAMISHSLAQYRVSNLGTFQLTRQSVVKSIQRLVDSVSPQNSLSAPEVKGIGPIPAVSAGGSKESRPAVPRSRRKVQGAGSAESGVERSDLRETSCNEDTQKVVDAIFEKALLGYLVTPKDLRILARHTDKFSLAQVLELNAPFFAERSGEFRPAFLSILALKRKDFSVSRSKSDDDRLTSILRTLTLDELLTMEKSSPESESAFFWNWIDPSKLTKESDRLERVKILVEKLKSSQDRASLTESKVYFETLLTKLEQNKSIKTYLYVEMVVAFEDVGILSLDEASNYLRRRMTLKLQVSSQDDFIEIVDLCETFPNVDFSRYALNRIDQSSTKQELNTAIALDPILNAAFEHRDTAYEATFGSEDGREERKALSDRIGMSAAGVFFENRGLFYLDVSNEMGLGRDFLVYDPRLKKFIDVEVKAALRTDADSLVHLSKTQIDRATAAAVDSSTTSFAFLVFGIEERQSRIRKVIWMTPVDFSSVELTPHEDRHYIFSAQLESLIRANQSNTEVIDFKFETP